MKLSRLLPAAFALGFALAFGAEAPLSEAMQNLLAPNLSSAELEKAAAQAVHDGAPKQTVAEAKLVWGLRHKDTEFLEKILPELEDAANNFKKENAVAVRSAEDIQGLVSYIKGMSAMKKGDEDAFKKNLTEAFWLSPEQAPLFGQAITNYRAAQKMASVIIDMKLPITTSKGEATTLGDQLGNNKAILLDFWASWCGPCLELMPELRREAAYLAEHQITVAGVNMESDEAVAEQVRRDRGMKIPWLVEPKGEPISGPLGITIIPRKVLISAEGKVLFNGFPQDPGLWTALKTLDSSIEPMKEE